MVKPSEHTRPSTPERLARLGRNFNAMGAVALGGLAVLVPGPNVVIGTLAGVNALQAGGFELLRRKAEKSRKRSHRFFSKNTS